MDQVGSRDASRVDGPHQHQIVLPRRQTAHREGAGCRGHIGHHLVTARVPHLPEDNGGGGCGGGKNGGCAEKDMEFTRYLWCNGYIEEGFHGIKAFHNMQYICLVNNLTVVIMLN